MAERLRATSAAQALIARLQAQHGAIYFYLSHGCCDGTSPMCLAPGELPLGPGDVQLGTVGGAAFWLNQGQNDYLANLQLTLDAVPGTNSNFSLEEGSGQRFVLQMALIDDAAPGA
jgi:uncharacterized protein (DUF779 family)